MQELRLVGVSEDGGHVLLATADDEEFAVVLDERLRAAVRRDRARLGQLESQLESQLRPREIQARIRAGESAEEVARAAGVPVERVRWFEGPVLQEREHIAASAKSTAVRRQGDGPVPLLGELVEQRLAKRGVDADDLAWDSYRREDGRWEIRVAFTAHGQDRAARWVFDAGRRMLTADDDEARSLSGEPPVSDRSRERPARTTRRERAFVPRIAAVRSGSDTGSAGAHRQPAPTAEQVELEDDFEEPIAAVAGTAAGSTGESPRAALPATPEAEETGGPEAARPRAGRRASVPSWDDIVFGTGRRA